MAQIDRESRRPDPLIDEIRAIRRDIVEQCGNDVEKLCDHLQELERDRLLEARRDELRREIAVGLADIESGRVRDLDVDRLIARLRQSQSPSAESPP